MSLTADLADDDLQAFLAMCRDVKVPYNALKRVMVSESNMTTTAICHVKGVPFAGGLSQLVNSTLHGLGYMDGVATFAALSFQDQLPVVARFYKQPMIFGKIKSDVDCYVSNWLPARIVHSADLSYVYATRGTALFDQNAGLDVNRDGVIDGHDLAARLATANASARAKEIEARLAALSAPDATA